MKMKNKILIAIAVIAVAALVYYIWDLNVQRARYASDAVIKAEVQTAIDVTRIIHQNAKDAGQSVDEAKVIAADALRRLNYGDNDEGYFFVDTKEGVNIVLYGNTEVEGKNRYEDKIGGVSYMKKIIDRAIAGGGYTDYFYPKKDGGDPLKKRAYSAYFEPFEWVIGTGYYLEDIK